MTSPTLNHPSSFRTSPWSPLSQIPTISFFLSPSFSFEVADLDDRRSRVVVEVKVYSNMGVPRTMDWDGETWILVMVRGYGRVEGRVRGVGVSDMMYVQKYTQTIDVLGAK
jgi:hypothetical protein